jgi:hypothetical protein
MLGEKKVELDRRERDLGLREELLVEAQFRGVNPQDNCEELMEFVELQKLLNEAEVERVTEIGRLAIIARDASKVLVDVGMPPIPRIPQDPRMIDDILEAVGVILESLQEAYASSHGPWD